LDPSRAKLSSFFSTPGSDSIELSFAAGQNQSSEFYVRGVRGARGPVTLEATHAQFETGTLQLEIVEPVLALAPSSIRLSALSVSPWLTVAASLDPAFRVSGDEGPLVVTVTTSDPSVGQFVTSAMPGGAPSVPVTIPAGQYSAAVRDDRAQCFGP
jgi:hypothetical protein